MSEQHKEHTVNGKATKVGDTVRYIGQDGRQHSATIKSLSGTHADLDAHVDGQPQTFTTVSHGTAGAPHTWDHSA